jgi:two-component system, OmpR family, sensor histidine kinase BaeS
MTTVDEDSRRLMSLVAHELRSPGAVVTGYLRLLAKNTAPALTEPERKMIDEANKSCGRLLQIAQELSELAELSADDPIRTWVPVPIFALCGEVVRTAADAGGAVSFSMDDGDKGACVEGHEGRLRQALGLLVSVVGRERGTSAMTVTGAISRTSESRVVLVFGEPSDATDLNTVVGYRDAAFDRWRGGTGLSLPIACRIIEAHRGTLWALPRGSRGSCALALPLAGAV